MAEDGRMGENLDGAPRGPAQRHTSGGQASAFRAPPPSPLDSTSLWTQFSGMPCHPGSPSSLQQWLHAMEGPGLSSDVFPRSPAPAPQSGAGFSTSPSSPSTVSSMHQTLNDVPPDFRHTRQPDGMASQTAAPSHHFDFRSVPDFDFSLPMDHQFSRSPPSSISPGQPSAAFAGMPPADFSKPPPDFTFGTPPDFSRPPPPFLPDLSRPPFAAADLPPPHLHNFGGLSELRNTGHQGPEGNPDLQFRPHSPHFDGASHVEDTAPKPQDIFSSHINISVPPPNFMPFTAFGDDLYARPADFDTTSRDLDASLHETEFGEVSSGPQRPRKIVRQNSEPAYKKMAEQEGKAMYMEALRRLNSFGPSYEPFGTKPAEQDPVKEPVVSASPPPVKESVPSKPMKSEPPRMSYSDVARSARGKPAHTKSEASEVFVAQDKGKAEAEIPGKKVMPDTSLKPPRQQTSRRHSHTKSGSHRTRGSSSETGHSFVQPSSMYGLDQFEDVSDGSFGRGEHCSSSMESLHTSPSPVGTRKSSTSSVGSGASAVEEMLHMKSGTTSCGGKNDTAKHRDKPCNVDTKEFTDKPVENHMNSARHMPKSATSAQTQKSKNEKLFFDPKRIFQTRDSSTTKTQNTANKMKTAGDKVNHDGWGTDAAKEETVLNNGKPNNTSSKATSAPHRKADYINNDLRDGGSGGLNINSNNSCSSGGGSKRTNQTAAQNRHSTLGKKHGSNKDSSAHNGTSEAKAKGADTRAKKQEPAAEEEVADRGPSFIRNIDWVLVDEWMKYISECSMTFARTSASAAVTVFLYLVGIIMYLVLGVIHLISMGVGKVWSFVKGKLFKGVDQGQDRWGQFPGGTENGRKRFGLEENITLPATGEEAMKRLLACKGKDPYSILGLRCDTSDEDIKRYYRKQAVLVHPDKNQEPGAEEAFKILGHAFEMIGEPAKRKEYDAHILEASEAEAAMREFTDLLTKLHEKVQEAANMMRCDNCGKKHRRIPVDRPWYSARFCDRCNIRHSAKEGDVWAESSVFGFLWHYYACMEGNIYDITEWVSCQRENFRHMKANAHPVYYRIQTDGSRRPRHGQSGEPDLEDFINRLFNKASMNPDGSPPPGWQFPSQHQGGASGASSSWGSAGGATGSKRSRRKKKKN